MTGLKRVCSALGVATLVAVGGPTALASAAPTDGPPTGAIFTNSARDSTFFFDGTGDVPSVVSTGPNGSDWDAAVSPDGVTTYVAHTPFFGATGTVELLAVDTALQTVRGVVASFPTPDGEWTRLALSPDGTTAYVTNAGRLFQITVATGAMSAGIAVGDARALAVSTDGRFVYVSAGTHLKRVNPRTGRVVADLDLGQVAGSIKFSSDGQWAYVIGDIVGNGGAKLYKVDLASFTVANQVGVLGSTALGAGTTMLGLAISPDQSRLYVTGGDRVSRRYFAQPVDATYLGVGSPVTVHETVPWPKTNDAAFSADGSTLYTYTVGEQGADVLIATIDVPSNSLTATVNVERLQSSTLTSVTTPPGQAPTAGFSAAPQCPGSVTSFDGSASSAAAGSIASYAWDFGDGSPVVTTPSPTTTHTYAATGRFAVQLTVTDTSGTSTSVVFDGQSVLRNGGATAKVRNQIRVPACH